MSAETRPEDKEIRHIIIWSLLVIGISILAFMADISMENEYDNFQKQVAQIID